MVKNNPSEMFCSILIPVVFKRLYRNQSPKPVAQFSSETVWSPFYHTGVAGEGHVADSEDLSQGVHYGAPWSQGPARSHSMRDTTCVGTEDS